MCACICTVILCKLCDNIPTLLDKPTVHTNIYTLLDTCMNYHLILLISSFNFNICKFLQTK